MCMWCVCVLYVYVFVCVGVSDGFSQGRGGMQRPAAREDESQHPYPASALCHPSCTRTSPGSLLPLLLMVRAHRAFRVGEQVWAPDG